MNPLITKYLGLSDSDVSNKVKTFLKLKEGFVYFDGFWHFVCPLDQDGEGSVYSICDEIHHFTEGYVIQSEPAGTVCPDCAREIAIEELS